MKQDGTGEPVEGGGTDTVLATTPYPPSPVIADIVWDWSSHRRRAAGSDNWPMTWADDDHQYTTWGDGGGFEGTNVKGRVTFGVARIEGGYEDYTGINIMGGVDPEQPHVEEIGYTWGLLFLDGVLYCYAGDSRAELYYSSDYGIHWQSAGWTLQDEGFIKVTILNYGRNYEGARDGYVYVYANTGPNLHRLNNDHVALARVPKGQMRDREAYEFFKGLQEGGEARWTADAAQMQPVFVYPGGVHWTMSVGHSPGLDRYFLLTNSAEWTEGEDLKVPTTNLEIFDAPNPWGPWTLAKACRNWKQTTYYAERYVFIFHFAPKWWRNGGKEFTMVFSGRGRYSDSTGNDSWNTINGRFVLWDELDDV